MKISAVLAIAGIAVVTWAAGAPVTRAQAPGESEGETRPGLAESFPAWAYPWDPTFKAPPAVATPHRVPGSSQSFSFVDARNLFMSPDWHPQDHPRMPEVVAFGRRPQVRACGVCHRAEGTGGPENASVAGLPASYIVQQMADFKSGARRFSGPRRAPVTLMIDVAQAATHAEVLEAAAYFSALRPKRNIKVVEADMIPSTYVAGNFYAFRQQGGLEPLGNRIVEVPLDQERFELRDTRSRFRAYAPPGSIARGAALATTPRAGTTITCGRCHGPSLRGTSQVPGIAGRSPSYIMRQLYDFRSGARSGPGSWQMKATVVALSDQDMLSLAAYLATLAPS